MSTSFYEAVLPSQGPYCAVGIQGGRVITTFHDNFEELSDRGDELASNGIDAYFALASFKDTEKGRKATNAAYLRSFFVDIDAGDGKPYEDQPTAAGALRAFISSTGLPEPAIVNSGRGLHAYWALTEAIPVEQWIPRAKAFKRLCVDRGFKADPAVSADAARILRMPGTKNFKSNPPLPVQVIVAGSPVTLETFTKALPEEPADLTEAKAYGMDSMTASIAQGEFPPTEFARIARKSVSGAGCAQIANALANAETLEEPLWRAALSIAWRCIDAESAIHKLSAAHPEYDPERTIAKAQGTKGPVTCQWYRDNYPGHCEGCTQKVTSPIQLGVKIAKTEVVNDTYVVEHQLEPDNAGVVSTVQVAIPAYPYPYFRGVNGGVYKRVKDDTENVTEVEIYKYDLYVTNRQYDSDEQGDGDGELVSVHLHTPHDGIRRFVAPVAHLLVKEKMRDLLLRHGVIALDNELKQIMAYLASSIRNLQKLYAADRTRNQMGWTPDLSGFVLGELEYTAKGVRLAPAASATRHLAPLLTPKGSLDEWVKIANFYTRPGLEVHSLALCFGFAAPLLRLYGGIEVRGAMINLMSNKSGTGKTTVQTVINSIFGHPSELLLKKDDTVNARMQWMGLMNHLPVTMDEVTNLTDEAASALIYDIPQGRGRHRMESQSNKMRVNTVSWQTFAISSSNSSMYDKLMRLKGTADGEIRRIIELQIARPLTITKAESDAVFRSLSQNYGVAGPRFIQYVMHNKAEVDAVFASFRGRLDADLDLDQSDRFYAMAFALALTAGYIAHKLGLFAISIQKLYEISLIHLRSIKASVIAPVIDTALTATEALTAFLNENLQNTLVINALKLNGLPNLPIHVPRGPLRVRLEPDTQEVWIASSLLRDYFVDRQIDTKSALNGFLMAGMLKHDGHAVSKRLGAGALAGYESASTRSYCFDAVRLGLDISDFQSPNAAHPNP